jgi:hypothetical protein
MPLAPIPVCFQASVEIEHGYPLPGFIDLARFQLRRRAMPEAINVSGKFGTGCNGR